MATDWRYWEPVETKDTNQPASLWQSAPGEWSSQCAEECAGVNIDFHPPLPVPTLGESVLPF